MILSAEGDESTGKSTILYTAPLPIVAISTDMGHERAIYGRLFQKYFKGLDIHFVRYPRDHKVVLPKDQTKGKDILVYECPAPMQTDPDRNRGYSELWKYFLEIFADQVQEDVGTFGVDTMTLLTKHKREAYLQEMQSKNPDRSQLQRLEYGKPNEAIRDVYQMAQAFRKNFVVTHHLKEHYVPYINDKGLPDSRWDGTWDTSGISDTAKQIDASIRMSKTKDGLRGTFGKCGYSLKTEGQSLPNPSWNSICDRIEMSGDWNGRPFDRRERINEDAD